MVCVGVCICMQVLVRAAASAAPAGRAHVDPAAAWSAAAEVPVITDAQVAYRLAREVLQERLEEVSPRVFVYARLRLLQMCLFIAMQLNTRSCVLSPRADVGTHQPGPTTPGY